MTASGTIVAFTVIAMFTGGCASAVADREVAAAQQRQTPAERRAAEETARKQAAASRELEEKLARQQLLLFEREAEIKALNQKLEAAILEVVRAMAKLRGLSGRAEAASNLAETEIALKAVSGDPGRPKDADLAQAQQLFAMATEEFKKQNYDGTVYLTSQVKMLIRPHGDRIAKPGEVRKADGELALASSLAVRASGRSNVREGPGPAFKVLFVIDKGTPLSALSYTGVWVRVKTDDGRAGWMHYTMLDPR
jgi:hypothetical protein